jgi:hypothetical protein
MNLLPTILMVFVVQPRQLFLVLQFTFERNIMKIFVNEFLGGRRFALALDVVDG